VVPRKTVTEAMSWQTVCAIWPLALRNLKKLSTEVSDMSYADAAAFLGIA